MVAKSLSYKGDVSEITHAIIDQNRLKDVSRDFVTSLFEAGVHCCVPEYIGEFKKYCLKVFVDRTDSVFINT